MSTIPAHIVAGRRKVADRFLSGNGIEIGALHCPLPVPAGAKVRYVDRMTVDDLRKHYPELKDFKLVPVDIVDEGETLATLPSDQLDFVIASHMLEHCQNPLGSIRSHLSKVRPGGVLYYAIPDKRCSFDRDRPLTSFEHLVEDDKLGADRSRWSHYLEWSKYVQKVPADGVEADARRTMERDYSIHFHVWDLDGFRKFIDGANAYLGSRFTVEYFGYNEVEAITILRRSAR